MADNEHGGFANAHRESRAVGSRLGEDSPRDDKGRSTLPAGPLSHAHSVRSYLGEDEYVRVTDAIPARGPSKPTRKRRKK